MKHHTLPAQQLSRLLIAGLALLILGLAFFAAPQVSSAQDTPAAGTVPPPILRPAITFVHGAAFNADPALTAVDVCTAQGEIVPGLGGLIYGEARAVSFDAGTFDWVITAAGSNCQTVLLDIAPFSLDNNMIKILMFTGDGADQPLAVLDILAQEGSAAFLPLVFKS
jgi:hypothetical protein